MRRWMLLIEVLRKGRAVSDPRTWKQRHLAVAALSGLLSAIAAALAAFGVVSIEISTDDAVAIAGGLFSLYCLFDAASTAATSDKVGLPDVDPPADRPPGAGRGGSSDDPTQYDDPRYYGS